MFKKDERLQFELKAEKLGYSATDWHRLTSSYNKNVAHVLSSVHTS